MSATANATGAEPVSSLSSSGSFTGKVNSYPIITTFGTQISKGDFVNLAVTGTIAKETGTTTMNAGLIGIFMGCSYTDPTSGQYVNSNFWPASNAATDAIAHVADDPYVIFRMQADGVMTQATLQSNVGINVTAGNTIFGLSRNTIDASDAAATNTLPIRIVGFVDGPDSVVGDAFTDCLCRFNGYHLNLSLFATSHGLGLALS